MKIHRTALRTLSALLALAPLGAAHAGPLYGTARQGGAPLAGARIEVACPSLAQPRARADALTDGSGAFSLRVPASGRCEMRVHRANVAGPPFAVFVSDNPVRFDFQVNPALVRVP